ncbi:MAG: hypothetical protein M0P26_08590, partial [Bacteroidales bacterium]|nr:hypothetical protein [Bacteroidales bacterium]
MNTQNIKLLLIMMLAIIFDMPSQATVHTLNQASGTISYLNEAYVDNMDEVYNINIGSNLPVKISYSVDVEPGCDFVFIYSVDNSGNSVLLESIDFFASGDTYTTIPNGKVKIVFYSDGSASYSEGWGTGFSVTFSADTRNASPQSFISGNATVMGNVGIGYNDPQNKLDVNGTIRATEVKVVSVGQFADFVFDRDYRLPKLTEVHNYIQENGHLPDIPSATEVKENGMSLVDMQVKLLQKIEELTLYMIDQQKE